MTKRIFTADEIAVIRNRFYGWEQASAKTLAAVFGVSVQQISAIVHDNRPDCLPIKHPPYNHPGDVA